MDRQVLGQAQEALGAELLARLGVPSETPRAAAPSFIYAGTAGGIDTGRDVTSYGLVRTISISQFKAHISEELRAVRRGERIIILDRDVPVAEVIPHQKSEESLVFRAPTRPLRLRRLGISAALDPLDLLRGERGLR